MSNRYYYCCSYPLRPSSIIEPGNWGRMIKNYNQSKSINFHVAVKEYVFEVVRLSNFPHLPSRLQSAFVFESADYLKQFMEQNCFNIGYEVDMVDPSLPSHKASIHLTNWDPSLPIKGLEEQAKAYWSVSDATASEIITLSAIRIVKRLS